MILEVYLQSDAEILIKRIKKNENQYIRLLRSNTKNNF